MTTHHPLLDDLYHADPAIQHRAIATLGEERVFAAIPELLMLSTSPAVAYNVDTRQRVNAAIAQMGASAVPLLIGYLYDGSFRLRVEAGEALAALGNCALPGVLTPVHLPHPERSRILTIYQSVNIFRHMDADVIPHLVPLLDNPAASVRLFATKALLGYDDARVVPLLCRLLEDRSEAVRAMAMGGLGDSGDPRAVFPLLSLDVYDNFVALQSVQRTFLDLGAAAVLPLVAVLEDGDVRWQLLAATMAGKLRAEKAVPALVKLLDSDHEPLVMEVVFALGMIGGTLAMRGLKQCTAPDSMHPSAVQRAALVTLKRLYNQ